MFQHLLNKLYFFDTVDDEDEDDEVEDIEEEEPYDIVFEGIKFFIKLMIADINIT